MTNQNYRFTDTHTHLYDEQFDQDREAIIQKSIAAGVTKMYLPNCDQTTIAPMMAMVEKWPEHCFPMMGLHPCYVKEDYKKELDLVAAWLEKEKFAAVGEIGLDYHWDTTFVTQQKEAFNIQMDWALQYKLPIVIHTRESMQDGIDMVRQKQDGSLRGVFHCFGGSAKEAKQITDLGFYLGIGGVVTFKKSTLNEVLAAVPLEHIVLETDAPYLAPVPYRGKRNESSYIPLIADKIAAIKQCNIAIVADITTKNAAQLFG
jgi:TatD DNase family protein